MSTDIVLAYKNNEISPYEIQGPQLLEILQNDQTRDEGLSIIGTGYLLAVKEELNQRMDRYHLVDSQTRDTIEQYKNVVWINKTTGEIELSLQEVGKLFKQEVSTIIRYENNDVKLDVPKIVLNFINVPRNIRKLTINKQINDKIRYIEQVYLDDASSPWQLSKHIEAGKDEINKRLKSGELNRIIKRIDSQKLYRMFCDSFSELSVVFDELHNDLEELKELLSKLDKSEINEGKEDM